MPAKKEKQASPPSRSGLPEGATRAQGVRSDVPPDHIRIRVVVPFSCGETGEVFERNKVLTFSKANAQAFLVPGLAERIEGQED